MSCGDVDGRRVGPVDVLADHHDRPARGSPRRSRCVAAMCGSGGRPALRSGSPPRPQGQAEQVGEVHAVSSASAWSTPRTSRRAASSAARLRLRRGEREAEDRPEQVDEQVVGQVAPVRDAAALEPAGGRRWGEGGNLELQREGGSCRCPARRRWRPTPTCGDDVEQRGQALQLLGAPDHGAVEPDGFEPAPAGGAAFRPMTRKAWIGSVLPLTSISPRSSRSNVSPAGGASSR